MPLPPYALLCCAVLGGGVQFVMYAAFGLGLWYGSTLIPEQASFDQVIKVFMVLIMTSFAIAETLTLAPDIAKGGYAITSVFNVLDRTPEMIPDDPKGTRGGREGRYRAEARHLRLPYPPRRQHFQRLLSQGKHLSLKVSTCLSR